MPLTKSHACPVGPGPGCRRLAAPPVVLTGIGTASVRCTAAVGSAVSDTIIKPATLIRTWGKQAQAASNIGHACHGIGVGGGAHSDAVGSTCW